MKPRHYFIHCTTRTNNKMINSWKEKIDRNHTGRFQKVENVLYMRIQSNLIIGLLIMDINLVILPFGSIVTWALEIEYCVLGYKGLASMAGVCPLLLIGVAVATAKNNYKTN